MIRRLDSSYPLQDFWHDGVPSLRPQRLNGI